MKYVNTGALDLLNFSFFCFGDSYLKILSSVFFWHYNEERWLHVCLSSYWKNTQKNKVNSDPTFCHFFFLLFRNLDLIILAMCLEYLYSWSANWLVIYLSYKGFWLNILWFSILSDISPALFSFFILRFARHLCCMPHS